MHASFRPVWLIGAISAVLVGVSVWLLLGPPASTKDAEPASGQGDATDAVADEDAVDASVQAPATETVDPLLKVRGDARFAEVTTPMAERWLSDTAGKRRHVRLIEMPKEPGRLVRVVDHIEPDRVTGGWRIVRQEVMAADSVVVGVPDRTGIDELARRLQEAGFATRAANPSDAVITIQLHDVTLDSVPAALTRISAEFPGVVAEPNFIYFPFQPTPADYDAAVMWGLENIEAPAAWTVSTGSESVVVAVIDTGIDLAHPDLVSRIWINSGEIVGNGADDDSNGFVDDVSGWNFAEGNATPADADDHGTHVSGTIGAIGSNDIGITGINWNVRIMALRVGNRTFESSNTLNALRYVNTMKQKGVNILAVNASFGGGSFSTLFREELIEARNNGVIFVAAAGNDHSDNDISPVYPAGYDVANIIAVAAIHPGNERSSFSNYGAASVDLAAPGTGIRSTVRNGGYEFFNGTSMAAPHVTGAVALIAAAEPALAWEGIRDRILGRVDPVPALAGVVATGGKLNLRRAVAPTLVPPAVTITVPSVDLVAMDRPGVPLALTATLAGENGITATGAITWEMVDGPLQVAFANSAQATTSVTFPVAGRYWLRVVATSGVFTRSDDLFVVVGESGYAEPELGLVASWSFNETGGTARDASGAGRHGTFVAGPSRVAGIERGGVAFDGANGRISFAATTFPTLSIAGWINPASTGGVSIFPRVLHMQSGLLFLGRDASTDPDDGNLNTLKFARDTGTDTRVWFAPPGTAGGGGWSHVAVTFDASTGGNATPRFYFEGRPQVTGTQASAASTPSVPPDIGYIGDRGDGGRAWNGALDELRIYDRELNRAEVAVLARLPAVREALAGRVFADLSAGSLTVPVSYLGSDGSTSTLAIAQPVWSALDGGVPPVSNGTTAATVAFAMAGSHTLRLDMVVDGAVHVVRTLPVRLNTSPVATAGHFSGSSSTGDVFALQVDADGTATLVGAANGGLSGESFQISDFGAFAFTARDGLFVTGQVSDDGTVTGTFGSGATFVGSKSASPSARPLIDGVYDGWVLEESVRASAIVADGRVTIAVEESGSGRSALGTVDETGVFDILGQQDSSLVGTVAGGRMDVVFNTPEGAGREIVLLRSDRVSNARLVNLSARGQAGVGENSMIAGFVVRGAEPLPVLVRAVGPGLESFGVSGVLSDPQLVLQSGSTVLAQNAGWDAGGDGPALIAAAALTGAFALNAGSHDAALLAAMDDGPYTATISSVGGSTGNVLGELFDAREISSQTSLVNISARARVGQGDAVAIGGFVIEGSDPALVLVRAAGPSLGALGVSQSLALTQLTVRKGGTVIATSDAWSEGAARRVVEAASAAAGAFSFADRSADAALLLYLPPGVYTAQVNGRENQTGVALVEVYLVDAE